MTIRSTETGMWCQNAPPSDPDKFPAPPGSGGTPCAFEEPERKEPDPDEDDEQA